MDWWQKLQKNPLARFGAILLLFFYIAVIGADFIAPYDPYESQPNASLLPPTQIHWVSKQGKLTTPYVYPTTQGPTNLETGERKIIINETKPSPIRLFVQGPEYRLLRLSLPLPPKWNEVLLIPGIPLKWHLFGADNGARVNILGTDDQSRDQFSRLLHGGRVSLFIGIFGIMISYPIGLLIGGVSGYFGGIVDTVIMRFVEVLMTFPSIYLLATLSGTLSPQLTSSQRFLLIVLITSVISWSGLARVIRGQVLSIKEREFVQIARAMGAKPLHIILRHILPQTTTYVVISATLSIPGFISAEAVLSLLGLGIQQPDPSWGNMLSLATNASILVLQPWLIWPAAILIILTVLAFNLLGDGLRDALDPRSLQR
ncbi:MAG TPA: ABC transporter permease [Nostocaceae cyanobacterium]|nr:ABC transporter permease [Nostocaceae cyanobacterium]